MRKWSQASLCVNILGNLLSRGSWEPIKEVLASSCYLYKGKCVFQVCELHFADGDILRVTLHIDAATGYTVTVPLKYPRLRQGAVPHRFHNCPNYLSTDVNIREDREVRRVRLEVDVLQTAVAESINLFQAEKEADGILGIKDVADYLRSKKSRFWHIIESSNRLILVHIVDDEAPWIKYSIVVNVDLRLTFHEGKTATKTLGSSLQIPAGDIFEISHLLLGQLSTTTAENKVHVIQFLSEQLALLSKKKQPRRYSVDFMIFCLYNFYNISSCLQVCPQQWKHFSPTPDDHQLNLLIVRDESSTRA
ncbi:hypothetical protein HPB47_014445 [Ixodes persulcatus]|uniref:Uncharacterized protein n=1 Tax=Ixodes persulcatus TaxID=34615 RepID=A0AC60QW33_IXOPE|nr:hypothetical protein HPB47_014445 [Ixodes persulcatus]